MKRQKKRPANETAKPSAWLPGAFLAAVTTIAYQPVWRAGFIWDDDAMLLDNPLIHQVGGWYQAWFTRAADDFVPATMTSLWLEWRVWGANPLGYHLDNVLLQVCSALVLWRVLLRLKIPGAWLAAGLFAVHPVNVESVAWIAQRKNMLAMLFLLATVQCYLTFEDSGRRRWFWLAAGLFLLALMSKTAVVPLPLVLLGLAWWRRGRIDRKDFQRSLVFIALAAAGSFMAIWIQQSAAIGMVVRVDNFWARLAGAGWALWFYLGKALLPLNLNFVYPRWEIPADNPLSYLPLVLWGAGLLICWRYRHGWGKGALFALGYFTVMLLPVLGFLNIYFMRYSLVSDHWQYFAIIGPLALAAAGCKKGLATLRSGNKWMTEICCATLLAGLGALTWQQCGMYDNIETLWQKTIRLNPHCSLAYLNLGVALEEKRRINEAIDHYRKALQFKPDFAEAHNDLGYALLQEGRVDEAISEYQAALQIRASFAEAHYNFGNALFQKGRVDEAISEYQAALQIKPRYAEAHYNLGIALAQTGKPGDAIPHYQSALQINPEFTNAHYNLGVALAQTGKPEAAITEYQKALRITPDNPTIQNNLAWLLSTCPTASLRNGNKAVELARQANAMTGGTNSIILHTLAAAYAEAGRFGDAKESIQKAIELSRASGQNWARQFNDEFKRYEAGLPLHQ